ncbi:MAG: hypothetical protein QOG53_3486 [Frankiales bacterium]|jgi:hypothetical protein|nr:hypothetical protein [Frankiales bacterium]
MSWEQKRSTLAADGEQFTVAFSSRGQTMLTTN